jgi:hypothetical protein
MMCPALHGTVKLFTGRADVTAMARTLTRRRTASRSRRHERVKREARDLVLQLFSAAGLLVAMPWALSYKAAPGTVRTGGRVPECGRSLIAGANPVADGTRPDRRHAHRCRSLPLATGVEAVRLVVFDALAR